VTIDGETARDFDDAVAVRGLDGNLIRLWVSIADVSHFVHERSPLDREAYSRGTSVYFPGDCLPMLPEQLSNDLCSLRPQVGRLTMTAQMDIDPAGNIVKSEFYSSVIQSRARMTYTSIRQILLDKDEEVRSRYQELLSSFELMEECFSRLRAKRIKRGSIDFDLPEPQINIDLTGKIENIVKAERHVGHMIIEEFMIAANESVAEFLTEAKVGCIYRAHEHPDSKKIHEFAILMHNLGYQIKIGERVPPATLARVVEMVEGKPEQRLVNTSLLRSMAQAVYSPDNIGHYGLASKCYCHFTSPIRRYPDLVVHRLLKIALAKKAKFPLLCKEGKGEVDLPHLTSPRLRQGYGGHAYKGEERKVSSLSSRVSGLQEIAEHCSRRERIAMEAEREMVKLHVALFMQNKIGQVFDGIISHVTKFGFFVELQEYFVEGLVHLDALPEDSYFFDKRGYSLKGKRCKKLFRIGDTVRIIVEEVDVPSRDVYFSLA
jgi:ribonuclease R